MEKEIKILKLNKYGQAAIIATNYYKTKKDPIKAWKAAINDMFTSKSSQDKRCPRSTFLALCEKGLVKSIPSGPYAKGIKENKEYALNAVDVLKNRNNHPDKISAIELWNQIQKKGTSPNSQMDVVLALWNNDLIL